MFLADSAIGGDSGNVWANSSANWVTNAVKCLISLIDGWHLDGIDVNYEDTSNGWSGFASNMCAALVAVKKQRSISVR